jgi:hypothetical protein
MYTYLDTYRKVLTCRGTNDARPKTPQGEVREAIGDRR